MDGLELSLASYAIAHLKLSLLLPPEVRSETRLPVYLSDTLAGPRSGVLEGITDPISAEGRHADEVKFSQRHSVVLGNPPYDRDSSGLDGSARRKGGMVRYDDDISKPGLIKDFIEPLSAAGGGVHAKNLYNDYVYFWRWAIWKVSEQSTVPGIISFITASSYLEGPGFGGMREVLRRRFDELWMLDLGGEGRGARKEANVFEGVLTPVVIGFAVRRPETDPQTRAGVPAIVRYRRISGSREEKLAALESITLSDDAGWSVGKKQWQAPFTIVPKSNFGRWPSLLDLMPWSGRGIQFSRSWPVAESEDLARSRWNALVGAPRQRRPQLLKESRDAVCDKSYTSFLTGERLLPISQLDTDAEPESIARIAFRSLDRQWCIGDRRVIDMPRPALWAARGPLQLFFTTLQKGELTSGPAICATTDVPDLNSFNNRGGLVLPLFHDREGVDENLSQGLLDLLSGCYGKIISTLDVAAYIYGFLGTAAYVAKFSHELASSTPRVPFSRDPATFDSVAEFGRQLLWWTTFGERCPPLDDQDLPVAWLPVGTAKTIKSIPATEEGYPESFSYDEASQSLHVGAGEFAPVSLDIWNFEVSGLRVVPSWLAYRMKKRAGRKSSPLDEIRPDSWRFTTQLLELLAVVEHLNNAAARGSELIDEVIEGHLIELGNLSAASRGRRKISIETQPSQAVPSLDG